MSLKSVLILLSLLINFAFSWKCGVEDPHLGKHLQVTPVVHEQVYETEEHVRHARRLRDQEYNESDSTFIPLSVAQNIPGMVQPIRIKVVWDVVDTGDKSNTTGNRFMCHYLNDNPLVQGSNGYIAWTEAAFPGSTPCSESHIVLGETYKQRYDLMRDRTDISVSYWHDTVSLKPVLDPIVIDSHIMTTLNIPLSARSHNDTDLVVIMTARPAPNSGVAGFAICYQRDQRGRCTVGQFNWVPDVFDIVNRFQYTNIESDIHTGIHEFMHLLGGVGPGVTTDSSPFIDDNGEQVTAGIYRVEIDPAYNDPGKYRTLITTPRVAAITQRDFNCPSAVGFPLEDVPLGKGSHWEARVMGPELMSYGSGAGQVYVSDLTLAFLEDTNQYLVNYSMAGPLLSYIENVPVRHGDSLTFLRRSLTDDTSGSGDIYRRVDVPYSSTPFSRVAINNSFAMTDPSIQYNVVPGNGGPYFNESALQNGTIRIPRGSLRYGYQGGCAFLNGNPVSSWPKGYLCAKNQQYMCTADNKMPAICIVRGNYNVQEQSCGAYMQDGSGATCPAPPVSGILPYMQWFSTVTEAQEASGNPNALPGTTGGYNNAMDYVPVPVGYLNCMYPLLLDNHTRLMKWDANFLWERFLSFFGSFTDIKSVGGQSRCPECRCLTSSLVEIAKGLNPLLPTYGLCYRTNCYRKDYLQVGVASLTKANTVFWYGCPSGGGKLQVTGFVGAIHCPNATEFCAAETITNFKYQEQNSMLEMVFWYGLTGIFLLLFLVSSCPCFRIPAVNALKSCVGSRVFERIDLRIDTLKPLEKRRFDSPDPMYAGPKPSRALKISLLVLNAVVGLCALFLVLASIYLSLLSSISGVANLLVGSFGVLLVCYFGARAGCARSLHGPSCYSILYFLSCIGLLLYTGSFVALTFAHDRWLGIIMGYFDSVVELLPESLISTSRSATMENLAVYMDGYQYAILAFSMLLLVIILCGIALVVKVMHVRTAISTFLVVSSHAAWIGGVVAMVIAASLAVDREGILQAAPTVFGLAFGLAILCILLGVIGLCGVFRRSIRLLVAFALLQLLLVVLCIIVAEFCFSGPTRLLNFIGSMNDEVLSEFAGVLDLPVTRTDFLLTISDSLLDFGLGFVVLIVYLLVMLLATASHTLLQRRIEMFHTYKDPSKLSKADMEVLYRVATSPSMPPSQFKSANASALASAKRRSAHSNSIDAYTLNPNSDDGHLTTSFNYRGQAGIATHALTTAAATNFSNKRASSIGSSKNGSQPSLQEQSSPRFNANNNNNSNSNVGSGGQVVSRNISVGGNNSALNQVQGGTRNANLNGYNNYSPSSVGGNNSALNNRGSSPVQNSIQGKHHNYYGGNSNGFSPDAVGRGRNGSQGSRNMNQYYG